MSATFVSHQTFRSSSELFRASASVGSASGEEIINIFASSIIFFSWINQAESWKTIKWNRLGWDASDSKSTFMDFTSTLIRRCHHLKYSRRHRVLLLWCMLHHTPKAIKIFSLDMCLPIFSIAWGGRRRKKNAECEHVIARRAKKFSEPQRSSRFACKVYFRKRVRGWFIASHNYLIRERTFS